MTVNAKVVVSCVVSDNTDYSNPFVRSAMANYTSTPEMAQAMTVLVDTVTAYRIELGQYAAAGPYTVIIKNRDADNGLDVDYTTQTGTATTAAQAQGDFVGPGKFCILTDVDEAQDVLLLANTADILCDVLVFGDAVA
jgi:hypothetical protein